MTNDEKKQRLLEIIYEIQDIYPELDRLLVDDVDSPNQIIIATEARLKEIAEEHDLDYELFDDYFDDGDFGKGGGNLQ